MNKKDPFNNPIRPLVALRALRKLIADPDKTEEVFVIISALSGNSRNRAFERFRSTPTGKKILQEERDILTVLRDRDRLERMPPASLGKTYSEFMSSEQISADGLVGASESGSRPQDPGEVDRLRFGVRVRDMHDLWHVATGYNRDLDGEACLLAFTYAQLRDRGIGLIVAMAWLRGGRFPGARKMIRHGYRRGAKAAWLPGVDWEALLSRPLLEVRAELGLGDPPSYEEMRSNEGKTALVSRQAA